MKMQNISDGTFILLPGSCPRDGTLGAGVPRGSIFFKHGHVAYQIDRVECKKTFILGSNW